MNFVSVAGLLLIFTLAIWLLARQGLLSGTRQIVLCTALTVTALLLRLYFFEHRTYDYRDFLAPWIQFFRDNGGFRALQHSIGNYNVPYLYFLALFSYFNIEGVYLIKLLSVLFDVVLAWAVMLLAQLYTKSKARQLWAFFGILFLPTVFLNGAVWGQCDSIYAAFGVLGLYLALTDRPVVSMVCFAASFAFKLQAVFLLPIIGVLTYKGKFSLLHWLIFPAAYVVMVLPAVLMGRPFMDTLTLYLSQTGSIGSGLNYNSSSMFAMLPHNANVAFWSKAGVILAFGFMLAVLWWLWAERKHVNYNVIYGAALLLAVGIPFILPHMHDRYFFIADVLALGFGVIFPRMLPVTVLVQFASLLGYHAYLKLQYLMPMKYGAYALLLTILLLITFIIYHFPAISQEKMRK